MSSLTIHHFRFLTEVVTPLELDEHSGSSLRGSFFEAIWKRFCTNRQAATCAACPLHTTCPVSTLVAPLREENPRGQDIPRPYILLPPLDGKRHYEPGETLSFGLTLFGNIIQLLPYIMLSIDMLESGGLGRRVPDHHSLRGRFTVKRVESCNLFSGEQHTIYEAGKPLVGTPTLAITDTTVQTRAATLSEERITLTFLTPTRLREQDRLVKHAEFRPLIHRLLERFIALDRTYGAGCGMDAQQHQLIEHVEQVRCLEDATHWEEVSSYSRRQQRFMPISGLRGRATFTGKLAPFRELLVWGEVMHVGKSCVKGNGWYKIEA
jgi:CRISPR-associated endoribonuclease Cas6